MKLNIKKKFIIYFLLLIYICILFTLYIEVNFHNRILTLIILAFLSLIMLSYFLFILMIRNHISLLLEQLSDMFSSLIDMRQEEVFSTLNDDMLSKLQFQVIKLKEILINQNKKVKKERDEIKSLISDISHQIKTPVSNLEIYYELLKDPTISKEQREDFIVNIKSQLRKLNFLMDSMIKMSRLESGIIKLNPKLGNLNETCLTAVKQVYQKAIIKNIKIEFIEKDNINMSYDANWTSEAIFNILDNAVKYTNINGEIIISIEKYSIYSRIDIKDNGTGLLEEEINNIFKRFYRGENSQKEEGVGLGLYLAREIITKQNGYIKVKSIKGSGTCFSIFLPI